MTLQKFLESSEIQALHQKNQILKIFQSQNSNYLPLKEYEITKTTIDSRFHPYNPFKASYNVTVWFTISYDPKEVCKHTCWGQEIIIKVFRDPQAPVPRSPKLIF